MKNIQPMSDTTQKITHEYVKDFFPERDPCMHKGKAGRVLIIAGSPGMAGAAVLSAGAALRSGAGLVYVSTPREQWQIVQTHEPCAVCVGRGIGASGGEPALPSLDEFDAIAIGPGIGTSAEARRLVRSVLEYHKSPLVIDADALNIIAEDYAPGADGTLPGNAAGVRAGAGTCRIITPHPGEAARLLGMRISEIENDRQAAVLALAEKYGVTAVLKGHATLVTGGDMVGDIIYENTTGNPGMATAGSGDILTGVIASFAAQGMSATDATNCGVFIHGLAGDIAAAEIGEYGMTAEDIMRTMPLAIREVAYEPDRTELVMLFASRDIEYEALTTHEVEVHKQEWFDRFVPKDKQQEALDSYCFSKDDCCGYLWHAFSYEIVDCLIRDEARKAFDEMDKQASVLMDNISRQAYKINDASKLRSDDIESLLSMDDVILTDLNFSWTYAKTHEESCGPYLCIRMGD